MSQNVDSLSTELDLEFPLRFQVHVSQTFPASTLLLNSATSYCAAVAHSPGSTFVEPCRVKEFYRNLLDFGNAIKKPLLECLEDMADVAVNGSSWVIVLPKLPPLFCDWWGGQLSMLREIGVQLSIHLILLADVLPCSWGAALRLRGSRLDAPRLDAFRAGSTLFEPSVGTKMSSELQSCSVQKRARAITFTTGGLVSDATTVSSLWVPQLLPSLQVSSKVLIDFPASDAIRVLSVVQVCAYRLRLQIPTDCWLHPSAL